MENRHNQIIGAPRINAPAFLPMSLCAVCNTPLEVRGTRTFCPACTLKGLWTEGDTPPDTDDDMAVTTVLPKTDGSAPVAKQATDVSWPTVPRHRLLEKLGEGGFAVVYRALQLEPVKREVAVKVLRASMTNEQVLARFEAERQVLARMEHAGIARLFDAGQTSNGEPFFAMELVRGLPITTWCRARSVGLRDRLSLMIQICDAVQHAHAKGVLHRDLKPSNLLVDDEGRMKVIDFGIAKALEVGPEDLPAYTTSVHQTVGTPGYMSPEQTEWGAQHMDARSDVYALGVVLYELIAGKTPLDVERRTNDKARRRAVASVIVPPSHLDSALPRTKTERRDLDAIALRALDRDPDLRYSSADALGADIERHLDDKPVDAAQQSWSYVLTKFARRHRGAFIGSTVAILGIIAALALSTVLFFREQKAHALADDALGLAQTRERDLRRALSRADYAAAQRFKQESDHQSAAASLARALVSDPTFTTAAADLQTLLAYGSFLQSVAPPLPLKSEWGQMARGVVSANGRTLAVGFRAVGDNTPRCMLWQRVGEAWQEQQIVLKGPLTDMALAPTGRLLVYVEGRRRLVMLGLEEGARPAPKEWISPPAQITCITIATQPPSAIAGLADGSVWNIPLEAGASPTKVFTTGHFVRAITCGTSPPFIVAGSDDGSVHRWAPPDSQPQQVLKLPAAVSSIAQYDNARQIAAGDTTGNVSWITPSQPATVHPMHHGVVTALAIGARGTIASAGNDLQVQWHEMETDAEIEPPVETAGTVERLDFGPEGDEISIITADASVRVWRRDGGAPLTVRKPQAARYVATSSVGRCLALQRDEGSALEVFDLATQGAVPLVLHPGDPPGIRGGMSTMSFSPDGQILTAADATGTTWRWHLDEADLEEPRTQQAPALAQHTMPDGKMRAALADGQLIEVSVKGDASEVIAPPDSPDATTPKTWQIAALSPDGQGAAWGESSAAPDKSCVIRWIDHIKHTSGQVRSQRLACLAWHPGLQLLIEGLHNGVVRIHHLDTGRIDTYSWHLSRVTAVDVSPDGKTLITGSADGTVALWNVDTGTPRSDYLRIGMPVHGAALSGDGHRFAVATQGQVMVGDVEQCALIGPPFPLHGYGGALTLNQDGTSLAAAARNGSLMVYKVASAPDAMPEWFTEMANAFVSRRFTEDGVLESIQHPGLAVIHSRLPSSATGAWNLFARWLLTSAGARTLTPWTTMTLNDYLRVTASRPGEVGAALRRRYAPSLYSLGIDIDAQQ